MTVHRQNFTELGARRALPRSRNAPTAHFGPLVRLALCLCLLAPKVGAAQDEIQLRLGQALTAIDQESDAKQIGRALSGFGSNALPELFDALRDGSYEAQTEEGVVAFPLSATQAGAVLQVLARIPAGTLEAFLVERTTLEPTAENRCTALRVMVPIARANDLTFCMQLAEPLSPGARVDSVAADYLQRCLEGMLSESDSVFRRLLPVFKRAHIGLRPAIVLAVTEVGTDAGFQSLSEFLDVSQELRVFILSSMGRIATTISLPVDELVAARIRKFERATDAKLVREALIVLGRIEDSHSVPRLIERLDSEDETLRAAAHWSLQHLSGLKLRDEPRRWSMWHETEASWWKVHAPQILSSLRSADVRERKRSIAIISQRRMRRHELARELLPLLSDSDETVVAQVVRALTILRVKSAAPQIEELLEHPSERVREKAEAALASW